MVDQAKNESNLSGHLGCARCPVCDRSGEGDWEKTTEHTGLSAPVEKEREGIQDRDDGQ